MESASPGPEALRLFYALELPPAARASLADWSRRELASLAGLRLVREESLHVTLCFLGRRGAAEVDAIAQAGREATAGRCAAWLACQGIAWLPPRRPGVLAVRLVEAGEQRLAELQSALAEALVSGGWYESERRPFLAHVTVGRVRRGVRIRPGELAAPPGEAFLADQVVLYRSRPSGAGSRYDPLATFSLAAPNRP